MKGRTPASPEAAKLKGNPGKRPPAEPAPAPEDFFPEPWAAPAWLPDGAKEIWARELPTVIRQTKLIEAGRQIFAMYCDALYRVEKYTAAIEEHGATYETPSGYRRKSPEVELRDRAAADMIKFAAELTLTPKSWIASEGTFQGRQLILPLDSGRSAAAMPTGKDVIADELSRFQDRRPTLQ